MNKEKIQEYRFAFAQTIPVMLGYIFLGIAFGLMLQDAGYNFWWAFFCSLFIYAGSMQFVLVTLLTDETYSVLCGLKVPEHMNENRIFFLISLFDQMYWIIGSVLGAVIGRLITFDTTGIDFSMTALFVVIVLNQWMDSKEHRPVLAGGAIGIICLLLLGADTFLLPALSITVLALLAGKKLCSRV